MAAHVETIVLRSIARSLAARLGSEPAILARLADQERLRTYRRPATRVAPCSATWDGSHVWSTASGSCAYCGTPTPASKRYTSPWDVDAKPCDPRTIVAPYAVAWEDPTADAAIEAVDGSTEHGDVDSTEHGDVDSTVYTLSAALNDQVTDDAAWVDLLDALVPDHAWTRDARPQALDAARAWLAEHAPDALEDFGPDIP